jgi:hypothetical protein
MPRRGELRAGAPLAAICCGISRIDEKQLRGADRCDEIGNNALMENATGQSSCFQCLEVEVDRGGLESVTYAKRTHCLISQQQELKNATVKTSPRENWVPCKYSGQRLGAFTMWRITSDRVARNSAATSGLRLRCHPMASPKSCVASG